jgi:PEGA domain
MKSCIVRPIVAILVAAGTCLAQEAPDWAKKEYEAPPGRVYAAALKSVLLQKHDLQAKDDQSHSIDFHVGLTAWSWGYNMRLVVSPADGGRSTVTIGVLRSGGKVFSWGSGRKEVRKIFAGIDAELVSSKVAGQNPPAPPGEASVPDSTIEVSSEPPGAEVDLDGKYIGNTPSTLRLKPGEYTLTVRKEGYSPWTRKITVIPDSRLSVEAELQKLD